MCGVDFHKDRKEQVWAAWLLVRLWLQVTGRPWVGNLFVTVTSLFSCKMVGEWVTGQGVGFLSTPVNCYLVTAGVSPPQRAVMS